MPPLDSYDGSSPDLQPRSDMHRFKKYKYLPFQCTIENQRKNNLIRWTIFN